MSYDGHLAKYVAFIEKAHADGFEPKEIADALLGMGVKTPFAADRPRASIANTIRHILKISSAHKRRERKAREAWVVHLSAGG